MHKKRILSALCAVLLFTPLNLTNVQAEDTTPSIVNNDQLLSDYAYIVDIDSGQILLDKNSDQQIYPASLTKMMTCIVAMENLTDLSQKVTITEEMLQGLYEAGASVAGFAVGDTPTVEDLFYCSALPSGADASNALAITTAGSVSDYVELMNEKAKEIGMNHTHFVNVTGLHDPDHYSTARDLSKLLLYCLKNEEFEKVFSADSYTTSSLSSAPNGLLVYSTTVIYADNGGFQLNGLIGSKTGYTEEAERCLAYWAANNNIRIAAVTAHAVQSNEHLWPHIEDAETVLNTLAGWQKTQLAVNDQVLGEIEVHNMFSDDTAVQILAPDDIILDYPQTEQLSLEVNIPLSTDSSYIEKNIDGTLVLQLNQQTISTEDISVTIPADPSFFGRLFKRIASIF